MNLENAVRDFFKTCQYDEHHLMKFNSLCLLNSQLKKLSVAFAEHVKTPKRDEWGQAIGAKPEKPGLKDHLKGVEAKNAELRKQLENERAEVGRLQDDLYKAEAVSETLQNQLMALRSLDQSRDFCQAQLREEVVRLERELQSAQIKLENIAEFRAAWARLQGMFV